MVKTPPTLKARKSLRTPKTLPKKMKASPSTESKEIDGKRTSLRRARLGVNSGLSIDAICTPSRTTRTRSMARVTDMPPPSMAYVTPSKRKTVASTKSSAKKSMAHNEEATGDGAFLRPSRLKSKKLNQFNGESALANENPTVAVDTLNDDELNRSKSKPKKTRKTMKVVDVTATDLSGTEDGLPSVSMLVTAGTNVHQLVRRNAVESAVESSDDDLASVSQLGAKRLSGQFVRSRLSMKLNSSHVESSEDDLPSVSMLGAGGKPIGRSRKSKSKLSMEMKVDSSEAASDSSVTPTPNKRTSISARLRKSIENSESAKVHSPLSTSSNRMSGQFVRSRKSKQMELGEEEAEVVQNTDTAAVEVDSKDVEGIKEQPSNTDERANVAMNIVIPTIVVTANDSKASIESSEMEEIKPASNANKSFKQRISVIDLTDSPMVQNTNVLNKTFSPIKGKEEDDIEDAKDRTFTEESDTNSGMNDKTFSPIPMVLTPIASKMKPLASSTTRRSIGKSTGKKSPPQLKRLQATPFTKAHTRNKLNSSLANASSAKKAKVIEAVAGLIDKPKRKAMVTLNVPKVTISSPQIFKFGENAKHGDTAFRFSMVAPILKNNEPASNSAVKSSVKPVPNFKGLHTTLFNKTESIDETRNRYNERAKILLSGKKPPQSQKIVVNRKAEKAAPKIKLNTTSKKVERRPLTNANRSRLNDDERQEMRLKSFKQGSKRANKKPIPEIKGVRVNRRFELMMQSRQMK